MRAIHVVSMSLLVLMLTSPAWPAKPDPSVGLSIEHPVDKSHFLPGDHVEVAVDVTDPLQLVRHVYVRLAAPNNHIMNGDQEASPPSGGRASPGQPETWKMDLPIPLSAVAGRYVVQVQLTGDGNTLLQWKTLSFDVGTATFGLSILSPPLGCVLSRNENFDVATQLADPRHKARRVFVLLEDVQKKLVLNGDREADRKGDTWTIRLHVPATAVPGAYRIVVQVTGEGREVLSTQTRPVTIAEAPIRLGDIMLAPSSGIKAGQNFQVVAALTDPQDIVRHVLVTVTGPNGTAVVQNMPAQRHRDSYELEVHLDDDAPVGNYSVEMQAVAQAGEVLASRRMAFPVHR